MLSLPIVFLTNWEAVSCFKPSEYNGGWTREPSSCCFRLRRAHSLRWENQFKVCHIQTVVMENNSMWVASNCIVVNNSPSSRPKSSKSDMLCLLRSTLEDVGVSAASAIVAVLDRLSASRVSVWAPRTTSCRSTDTVGLDRRQKIEETTQLFARVSPQIKYDWLA